ncbi:hypothetical protein QQX10_00825 [Demequina sp. SYSU T00039]|uniref:Tfp pilus assembly protein PilN n=1 Tax=Demequina lignilytica TaxID=3051663 RepID=A0AAW7M7A7_9MICO|nr:hypothetical protein [Demequina sp. SYSU T00039]MDN4486705.1 hypothetical protein [Demequina sp. SYSU T00039]
MNPTAQKYGASVLAGVNLIPADIAERKKMRAVRTTAVIVVLIAVGAVVVAFLLALAARGVAQLDLDNASRDQEAAIAERDGKAQVYTDALQREREEYTLAQIGFGEIDYAQLTAQIQATRSDTASFDSILVHGPTADTLGAGPRDDLYGGAVGTFEFEARAESQASASALLRRLEAIPGIADVRGVTEAFATEGGVDYWEVSGTGSITAKWLTLRLVPEDGFAGVDAVTVVEAQDTDEESPLTAPSATPSPSAEPTASPSAGEEN